MLIEAKGITAVTLRLATGIHPVLTPSITPRNYIFRPNCGTTIHGPIITVILRRRRRPCAAGYRCHPDRLWVYLCRRHRAYPWVRPGDSFHLLRRHRAYPWVCRGDSFHLLRRLFRGTGRRLRKGSGHASRHLRSAPDSIQIGGLRTSRGSPRAVPDGLLGSPALCRIWPSPFITRNG